MRELTDAARLRAFMRALAAEADQEARVYFTGGATAVLLGWRPTTIDGLRMNVELASPAHFIPELPGWEERSPFIAREGKVSFHHYDLYSQALSKIERGHAQDRQDVAVMLQRGLVEPARVRELFAAIEPKLYRYPALDPASFRRAVEEALARG
ncbi:MAG: hypothetical protein DMF80_06430 [Acidobacteria bacterium]|nr:MAG: hypothetical protein DMF80_06430 [Acidobacteriota bacterium]